MISEAHLAQLRQLIETILAEHGIKKLGSPAAQRQRRYREKLRAVTKHNAPITKRNAPKGSSVTKHNGHNSVTFAVWDGYSSAYRGRYQVDPVRNAKVNGQIAQLVKRVGEDAGPMAAWYVGHGAQRYVAAGHSIGLLLQDAEKLHTEWQTGRRVTATAAAQSDRTQATGDVFRKLIEEARNGKIT